MVVIYPFLLYTALFLILSTFYEEDHNQYLVMLSYTHTDIYIYIKLKNLFKAYIKKMGKTKKYTLFKAIFRYIYMKTKYEIFLQWNTKTFLQKVLFLLHFGPCQNCMSSANLVAKFTRNVVLNEVWALENHVLENMLLCSSHFAEVH